MFDETSIQEVFDGIHVGLMRHELRRAEEIF